LKVVVRGKGITTKCIAFALLLAGLPAVTGCASLFISKRKLLVPIAPASVQTATGDELAARVNDQWAKFESLTASVEIQARRLQTAKGVESDYPTFRANILVRKPEMIRILGKAPVVQTTMFDLASDGKRFTLLVPPKSKVYQGESAAKGNSPNWYENLRPGFLFNAMVVKGLTPDELYSVTSDTITEEDTKNKRLLSHPEYVLSVVRHKPGSQELYPVRVIHFHREDLLPYEQDLYDENGSLETQIAYGAYKDFGGFKFPGTMTLKRPQEEYQLSLTIERVVSNPPLTDDQFHVKIPASGYTVQELK
jgi:outer membrane lipoprotein-sorting protein